MAYCAASDVRLIIETELTDAQIDSIITMSDAEIDARIAPDGGDDRIKRLSMLITARTIMFRYPQVQAIGEYREDRGRMMEYLDREIERLFSGQKTVSIASSEYRHIDEDTRYPEA